jgi:DNA-binding NtrC family response regulator
MSDGRALDSEADSRVFLLDDDADLRESVVEILRVMTGADCVSAASVAQMMEQHEAVLCCTLAILDVNLGAGRPSGLDAFHWLRARSFSGTIAFLTGHARHHPLVADAYQIGETKVLEKPIDFDRLAAMIAVPPQRTGPGA